MVFVVGGGGVFGGFGVVWLFYVGGELVVVGLFG